MLGILGTIGRTAASAGGSALKAAGATLPKMGKVLLSGVGSVAKSVLGGSGGVGSFHEGNLHEQHDKKIEIQNDKTQKTSDYDTEYTPKEKPDLLRTPFKNEKISTSDVLKALQQVSDKAVRETNLVNKNFLKGFDYVEGELKRQGTYLTRINRKADIVLAKQSTLRIELDRLKYNLSNEKINKKSELKQEAQQQPLVNEPTDEGKENKDESTVQTVAKSITKLVGAGVAYLLGKRLIDNLSGSKSKENTKQNYPGYYNELMGNDNPEQEINIVSKKIKLSADEITFDADKFTFLRAHLGAGSGLNKPEKSSSTQKETAIQSKYPDYYNKMMGYTPSNDPRAEMATIDPTGFKTKDGRDLPEIMGYGQSGFGGSGATGSYPSTGATRSTSSSTENISPSINKAASGKNTGSVISDAMAGNISATSTAVQEALKTEGLHESRDREQLISFMKSAGKGYIDPSNAWCASFVNAVLQKTGIKGTGSAAAGSFHSWGNKVEDASSVSKADVLVNYRRSPRTGMIGSHVTMATGEVKRDKAGRITHIETIGGNEKNKVTKEWKSFGEVQKNWAIRRSAVEGLPEEDQRKIKGELNNAPTVSLNKNEQAALKTENINPVNKNNQIGIFGNTSLNVFENKNVVIPNRIEGQSNKEIVMKAFVDQLRKEGVPEKNLPHAAALLAGQVQYESGFKPTLTHDQGTGYGIYGARLKRREEMFNWLNENKFSKDSAEGQGRYMAYEAMNKREYAISKAALMNASEENMKIGARTLTTNFERPREQEQNSINRYNAARDFLKDTQRIVSSDIQLGKQSLWNEQPYINNTQGIGLESAAYGQSKGEFVDDQQGNLIQQPTPSSPDLTPWEAPEPKQYDEKIWSEGTDAIPNMSKEEQSEQNRFGRDYTDTIKQERSRDSHGVRRPDHNPEGRGSEPGSNAYGPSRDPDNLGLCTI